MYCEKCGDIKSASVHGYDFGDRLLEDVYFEFDLVDGKPVNVRTEESAVDYMDDLNEAKWLKAAAEYIQDVLDDAELESFRCVSCLAHGVWMDEEEYKKENA